MAMYIYIYIYIYTHTHIHIPTTLRQDRRLRPRLFVIILRGAKGVPRKGVWTSVNRRFWKCKELRTKHGQASCCLRPPCLGTPLVPSRTIAAVVTNSKNSNRSNSNNSNTSSNSNDSNTSNRSDTGRISFERTEWPADRSKHGGTTGH